MIHRLVRSTAFFRVALAAPLLLAAPAGAFAQAGGDAVVGEDGREEAETRYDDNLDQAARRVFLSARQAFAAGQYEEALARFRQAYELSPRPTLLYNIAATLDRLRRDEEAVEALKAYLEAAPDAEDRTEIEARIRVLEQAVATRQAQQADTHTDTDTQTDTDTDSDTDTDPDTDADVVPPVTEPEERGGLHPAIVIAVGGAALVAGGLLLWSGLDTNSKDDELVAYVEEPDATLEVGEQMLEDAESAATRTNILMGLAIGLGAAAAVLAIFTDWGGSDDEPGDGSITVGGMAGPDGGLVGLGGSF